MNADLHALTRAQLEAELARLGTDWDRSDDARVWRRGHALQKALAALQEPTPALPAHHEGPTRAQRWRRATSRGYRHDHERY